MTIERCGDFFELFCDVCGESETFFEFYDAVKHKETAGWKSQERRGEWEDVCPECQGE